MEAQNALYPEAETLDSGLLKVSNVHQIFWQVSGNKEGKSALILHGGPGSSPFHKRYFDPSYYMIVQFDQRGSGSSLPSACIEENTTWDLVNDCEAIRELLGVKKWYIVLGGSWGSTLALAYSQTHNERLENLTICSIYLCEL